MSTVRRTPLRVHLRRLRRALRRAYRRGGVAELVRAARRALARAVYPGDPRVLLRTAARPAPAPGHDGADAPESAPAPGAPGSAHRASAVPAQPAPPSAETVAATPPVATTVSYEDALAFFERRRATYDRLAAAVAPYVEPDGVIFDVGANIGHFTRVLSRATGFRGTAHLFEPLPRLAELCRVTAAGLDCTAVVHEVGLGDEASDVDLFVATGGNLGWNTMVAEQTSKDMLPVRVRVLPLAETGVTDRPDFVKIDVEGAEYRVLAGMLDALAGWTPRPAILCEIGWGQGHPAWNAELQVFGRLADLGYAAHDLDGVPVDLAGLTRTTDVLFLPEHLRPPPAEEPVDEPAGALADDAADEAADKAAPGTPLEATPEPRTGGRTSRCVDVRDTTTPVFTG